MSVYGSYYFILGPLFLFMFLMQELSREKELRLRQGLAVVGVTHTAYWVHWTIVGTILNLLQVIVLIICGFCFGFELWHNCLTSILFKEFFWFGQCMMVSAFMMSTLVKTQEKANFYSYTLILIMLFVNALFSNCDFCLKLFYSELSQGIGVIRFIVGFFEFIPSYSFSMAFGTVAIRASRRFDYNTVSWNPGSAFGYDEYNQDIKF